MRLAARRMGATGQGTALARHQPRKMCIRLNLQAG